MYYVILQMPAPTDFETLPTAVQSAIQQADGRYPGPIMPGTRPAADGSVIVNALVDVPPSDVHALITALGLPWQIWYARSLRSEDTGQLDAAGNPILAPVEYVPFDARIRDYVIPPLDAAGNPQPLPVPTPLARFSIRGVAPVVMP